MSSSNDLTAFPSQQLPTAEPSQALVWWLGVERCVAEAAGLSDVAHPLLSPEVVRLYGHMGPNSRQAVERDACSGALLLLEQPPTTTAGDDGHGMTQGREARSRHAAGQGSGWRGEERAEEQQEAWQRPSRQAPAQPEPVKRPDYGSDRDESRRSARGFDQPQPPAQQTSTPAAARAQMPPPPPPPATRPSQLPSGVRAAHFRELLPAYLSREAGDFDKSLGHLSRMLTRAPASDRALVANITGEMGVTYEMQGRLADAVRWFRRSVDTDPAYHEGYLLFARLFLGPASAFVNSNDKVKHELVRVLQQQVQQPSPPPQGLGYGPSAWHELALYNLASALFYLGRPEEADAIYLDFLDLPPPSHPQQHGRRYTPR